jgi:hypothetical protein
MLHPMRLALLLACSLLAACGGTKLVKHAPDIPVRDAPLASTQDETLGIALDFVVVRNGPGAWARNADWDEYLLHLHHRGDQPLQVTRVEVEDMLGHRAASASDRRELLDGSKATAKRYRAAGLKVSAGHGGAMIVAGVGAGVVGYGAAVVATTGAALGAGGAASGGTAASAAGGLVLAAPILVGVGIARMVGNAKVGKRIAARATPLPFALAPGETKAIDLFFPLSPSPRRIIVHYRDDRGDHSLAVDTTQALAGLHLPKADAHARQP